MFIAQRVANLRTPSGVECEYVCNDEIESLAAKTHSTPMGFANIWIVAGYKHLTPNGVEYHR